MNKKLKQNCWRKRHRKCIPFERKKEKKVLETNNIKVNKIRYMTKSTNTCGNNIHPHINCPIP